MRRCNYERLKKYLDTYGWVYQFDGSNVFYSGWRGVDRTYSLRVEFNDSFILFEVKLLVLSEMLQKKRWKSIMELLVKLNQKMSVAKLGLNEDGMILLLVEVFSEDFSYKHLSHVLGLIGFYSEKILEEILDRMGTIVGSEAHLPRYLM